MSILDNIEGDGKLQTEKQIAVKQSALNEMVDEVMRKYLDWLAGWEGRTDEEDYESAVDKLRHHRVDQRVIDEFCVRLNSYQDLGSFHEGGVFISALIQSAYEHGCKDLVIRMARVEAEINRVGKLVSASEDDPLGIIIDGDAGWWCGSGARYSGFTFTGDAGGGCGEDAEHSRFTFRGDAESWCGSKAKYSEFIFLGDIGYRCGRDAEHCTFSSPRMYVLERIRGCARPSCSFYLIESDGTHKEVFR